MTTATQKQEFTFQAEIKQLLHLLSHSLYQSREIAIRELISNASDALDKMRYVALTDENDRDDGATGDHDRPREDVEKTLVIRDNGIGMTHDELVTNLGTIAHSGSRRVPQAALGRCPGPGRPVLDRPVRRRLLLGVHDRRQRRSSDPQLP